MSTFLQSSFHDLFCFVFEKLITGHRMSHQYQLGLFHFGDWTLCFEHTFLARKKSFEFCYLVLWIYYVWKCCYHSEPILLEVTMASSLEVSHFDWTFASFKAFIIIFALDFQNQGIGIDSQSKQYNSLHSRKLLIYRSLNRRSLTSLILINTYISDQMYGIILEIQLMISEHISCLIESYSFSEQCS